MGHICGMTRTDFGDTFMITYLPWISMFGPWYPPPLLALPSETGSRDIDVVIGVAENT